MKLRTLALSLVAVFATQACADNNRDISLDTQQEKVSYSIGVDIGRSLTASEIDIDMDSFSQGISDGVAGDDTLLTDEEMEQTLISFQEELMAEQQAEQQAIADANAAQEDTFLSANAAREGVVVLDSGLQYSIIEEGTGISPDSNDIVSVHYQGTLPDGTVFDSSYERGEPASFPVNAVISGWTEALQLMQVGDKWELYIPSDLAYGETGTAGVIGPNQVLIFEVELLDVDQIENAAAVSVEDGVDMS